MKKNCKDCKRMECFQIAKVHSLQNTAKKSTQLCVHIENCNSKHRVALCFTFYCLMLIKSVWLAVVKISVEKSRYVLGNFFLDKFLTFSKSLIGRLVNSFMWFVIQPFFLLLSNDKKNQWPPRYPDTFQSQLELWARNVLGYPFPTDTRNFFSVYPPWFGS